MCHIVFNLRRAFIVGFFKDLPQKKAITMRTESNGLRERNRASR